MTKSNYIAIITASILTVSLAVVCIYAIAIPDVHFSYSTDECIKVLNYDEDDKYSCENMPTKFNHVWVK
jgi:hypothetical protein